jgi:hypothetical protein
VTCEQCWIDAYELQYSRGFDSQGAAYLSIILYCNHKAEERAGADAEGCPMCARRTIHQHGRECVTCGYSEAKAASA